jgi:hypothetical protein
MGGPGRVVSADLKMHGWILRLIGTRRLLCICKIIGTQSYQAPLQIRAVREALWLQTEISLSQKAQTCLPMKNGAGQTFLFEGDEG